MIELTPTTETINPARIIPIKFLKSILKSVTRSIPYKYNDVANSLKKQIFWSILLINGLLYINCDCDAIESIRRLNIYNSEWLCKNINITEVIVHLKAIITFQ